MPKQPKPQMDLPTLVEKFSNEDACHAYLEDLRWPDGVECPGRRGPDGVRAGCGGKKLARLAERRLFECMACGYQFSTRVGTIFEDSKLPLWKWFLAVFLMAESKKGMSANQIKRMLSVTYKTAWFLCHRIRSAMKDDAGELLSGIVEADETFIGGKRRGVGSGPHHPHITPVIGVVERGGKVRLAVAKDRTRRTLHRFIKAKVSPNAEAIHTDAWQAYRGVGTDTTEHKTVNHHAGEWVNGNIHTNTMEGVWSLLDRSIVGAYHKVSKKHLPAYLHEVEFRFNNRGNPYLFRDTILELVRCEQLEYKRLTA
jgi:transposase-like protein